MADKTLLGYFDRNQMLSDESRVSPTQHGSETVSKEKMSALLEEYRDKLFPFHKLEQFVAPNDLNDEDIRRLMEATGRIKQGEKVYEPFAEYLK